MLKANTCQEIFLSLNHFSASEGQRRRMEGGGNPGMVELIRAIPESFLFSHEKIEIIKIDEASEG